MTTTKRNQETWWARGALASAATCALTACAPEIPAVEKRGSALADINCPASQVISMQAGKGASCDKAYPGEGGLWVGQTLIETRRQTYCSHSWQPDTQTPTAPPDLAALRTLDNAEVDCPVTTPSAGFSSSGDWVAFRESFHKQAARVPSLPQPKQQVRIAIIDSAARPYDGMDEDRFGHGRLMGRIVGDLACADPFAPECANQIRNYLALPQVSATERDFVKGGYYGTRGDLVLALQRALEDWIKEPLAREGRLKLVLSMSLGWEATLDRRHPSKLPGETARLVLERASCLGAITVAAAGNGASAKGALLPAAWESQPAPDAAKCHDLGFVPEQTKEPTKGGGGRYRPLLHAVGAVDATDRPLVSSRVLGLPRLVAYGLAVGTDDPRTKKTLVLSGSSTATAVVAGTAAATWALTPDLSAAEVMDLVYDKSTGLGSTAQFCLGGAPCAFEQRRVGACGPLESVVGPVACTTMPVGAGAAPAPVLPAPPVELGPVAGCNGAGCLGPLGTTPVRASAPSQLEPWLLPQPSWPGCRTCVLYPQINWLYADLDPSIPGEGMNVMRVRTDLGDLIDVPGPLASAAVPPPLPQVFGASPSVNYWSWGAAAAFGKDLGFDVVVQTKEESILVVRW